jgi:hypothetical protein
MWEISQLRLMILILLGFSILILIGYLFISIRYGLGLNNTTIVRGIGGTGGDTLKLTCPVGKSMTIVSARYGCADVGKHKYAIPACDPMKSNGELDPTTTVDASPLFSDCGGTSSCTVTVPTSVDGLCSSCESTMIIGTYTCS